jgi:hypothetical protein
MPRYTLTDLQRSDNRPVGTFPFREAAALFADALGIPEVARLIECKGTIPAADHPDARPYVAARKQLAEDREMAASARAALGEPLALTSLEHAQTVARTFRKAG